MIDAYTYAYACTHTHTHTYSHAILTFDLIYFRSD
jgi:hypothetical protein